MSANKEKDQLVTPLSTTFLNAEPSCIEFAPKLLDIFVVGSYTLETQPEESTAGQELPSTDGSQKRTGALSIFRLEKNAEVCVEWLGLAIQRRLNVS